MRVSVRCCNTSTTTCLRARSGEAQLVVLPYRQMLNSGALLLALSLARPVLAPWSGANAAIAEEVGEGWLTLYRGELDAATLAAALRRQAGRDPRARPGPVAARLARARRAALRQLSAARCAT